MAKIQLFIVPLFAACVVGCAGGSTGDPGVDDWISIDDPGAPSVVPPPGGACESPQPTARIADVDGPRPRPRSRLREISASEGLWLDTVRGIVVDVSAPDAMHVRGRIPVGELIDVAPLQPRRLLAGVRRSFYKYGSDDPRAVALSTDELVVLGFDDPDAPQVLARASLPGEIVMVAPRRKGASWSIDVVSDEPDSRCVDPTKESYLRRFTLDGDTLSEPALLALGSQLAVVAQRADQLVLFEGLARSVGTGSPPVMRLVGPGDALEPSEPVVAPGPIVDPEQIWLSESDGVLTAIALGGQPRIVRYDLRDASAPSVMSDCSAAASDGANPAAAAWSVGDRFYLASEPPQMDGGLLSGNHLVELSATCELMRERRGLWLVALPDGDRFVELDASSGTAIEARLRSAAQPEPIAVSRVELPEGLRAHYDASVLPGYVPLAQNDSETLGLVGVRLVEGFASKQLQLFRVSENGIDAVTAIEESEEPGRSARAWSLALPTAWGVATLNAAQQDILSSYELAPSGAVSPLGELDLAPEFARGALLDESYFLRVRRPQDELVSTLSDSPEPRSTVEVVQRDVDPEYGGASASIEIERSAQLVRVGALWVAVHNDPQGMPGETRLEVHDLSDPLAPRVRGTLTSDALWVQDNSGTRRGPGVECLACDPPGGSGPFALTTERALVLRGHTWVEDSAKGHNALTLHVVDFSDPDAPKLGSSFELPREDHSLGAVADGDMVYAFFKRPLDDGRVRFSVLQLDLSTPSAPHVWEPIVLPGAPALVQGDTLFTRELVRDGDALQTIVHRVRIERGIAHLLASRNVGERYVQVVSADGDRVYVDLGDRLDAEPVTSAEGGVGHTPPPRRLLVLDAESLEEIAAGDIPGRGLRIAARSDAVLYTAWGGVLRVDPLDPGNVDLQELTTFEHSFGSYLDVSSDDRSVMLVGREYGRLRLVDL